MHEMVSRVADTVLQMFGGAGYTKDLPIERIWREVRVARILDGTSEILRGIIAREMLQGHSMKTHRTAEGDSAWPRPT